MSRPSFRTALTIVSTAALLAACGGGDGNPGVQAQQAAREFALQISAARPDKVAQSAALLTPAPTEHPQAVASVGAKELFDWAVFTFPTLFKSGTADFPFTYQGVTYTVRAFAEGAYLGLTASGDIYGLGPFTGNVLTKFGNITDFVARVQADSCRVYPGSCGPTTEPSGPVTDCTMTAAQFLVPGNRLIATYAQTGVATAEVSLDSQVIGNATFEGQSVVRVDSTVKVTTTVQGFSSTSSTKSKSYEQAAQGGMVRTIGDESETTTGGGTLMGFPIPTTVTNVRTVFKPGVLNSEFTLALGQSLNKTTAGSSSASTNGAPPTTSSFSDVETYTFEARETIVVRGKSYNTCRFKQTDPKTPNSPTVTWHIVGKGVPVRTTSVNGNDTSTQELVSGTFNGAPL